MADRIGARIGRRYSRATLRFLPRRIRADREAANQARMFLISHFFGPFLGLTVPLALYLLDPTPGYDIVVLALSIMGFWLFPVMMRRGVAYDRLVVLSVLNLHFAILWSCFFYGGINSPTVIWVLIIPILCIFYGGGARWMNRRLLVTSLASLGVFFVCYIRLPVPPNDLPLAANIGLGAVSTVATLCYVAAMAIYYARIFDAGVDLENEVQRRRRLAVELREAVIAANHASASKSEFLARMSHELRTPLNAIMGYAQLLREEAEESRDDALKDDVARILDAGEYLVRLIDLILDLSKIEAGRMELQPRSCNVRELVADAAERRRGQFEQRGNELRVLLDAVPRHARTDHGQLRKVLDAILENAAQHTRDGMVTINGGRRLVGEREYFSIAVEDTGEGIEPDLLPNVLETFALTRNAARGRYGGTGLSLTVASKLCQLMGGWIEVQSRLGRGSRFTVALPREIDETRTRSATRAPALAAARAAR